MSNLSVKIIEYGTNPTTQPTPEMMNEIGEILENYGQLGRIGLVLLDTQNLIAQPEEDTIALERTNLEKRQLFVKAEKLDYVGPHIITTKTFSDDPKVKACRTACPTNNQYKHFPIHERTSE